MTKTMKLMAFLMLSVFAMVAIVNAGMNVELKPDGDYVCTFQPDYEIHYVGSFVWEKNGAVVKTDTRNYGSVSQVFYEESTISGVTLTAQDSLKCTVSYALTAPNYGILYDSITLTGEGTVSEDAPTVEIEPVYPYPTTDELTCSAPGLPVQSTGYYWYDRNNVRIVGADEAVLTSAMAGGFQVGDRFKCIVKNELAYPAPYVYGSALVSVIRDPNAEAPTASIISPVDGGTSRSDVLVYFSSIVTGTEPLVYNWSSSISGDLSDEKDFSDTLAVGTHIITLTVTDAYGEEAVDSITYNIVSPTGPVVSISYPSDNDRFYFGELVEFSASITDDDTIDSIIWTSDLDGILVQGNNQVTFDTDTLSIGTHTITVIATDSDGYVSSDNVMIQVVNADSPKISVVFPNDGDVFKQGDRIWFIATGKDIDDTIVSWTWTSDVDGLLSNNPIFSTSSLSAGLHTITLEATDSFGVFHKVEYNIEVLVNLDGFNAASIVSPNQYDRFEEGQMILFSGLIHDPTPGSTVVWSSNQDGALGIGNVLNIDTLSRGLHRITFTVVSPDGKVSRDSIEIYVEGSLDPTASILRPSNEAVYIEGQDIYFNALGDGSADLSYYWSSTVEGTLSQSRYFSSTEMVPGKHILTLRVESADGSSVDKKYMYVLPSTSPTSSITSPAAGTSIKYGRNVNFVVAASGVTSGQWISDIQGVLGNTISLSTNELMVGHHKITFLGFKTDGSFTIDRIDLYVLPVTGPTVTITSPINGETFVKGNEIEFDATGSDEDGLITQWQWVSDIDGVIGMTRSFNTTELSLGKHDITVTVVDNDANRYSATHTIWILVNPSDAPEGMIISPHDGDFFNESEEIFFDSSATATTGRTITTYRWESSIDGLLSLEQSFTAILSNGRHDITLTVIDSEGYIDLAQIEIFVGPQNGTGNSETPIAMINAPSTVFVGEEVDFTSTGSHDPDGTIVSYEWNFGEGAPAFIANPSYTFENVGTYEVTLTVTDNSGNSGSAQKTITVRDRADEIDPEDFSSRESIFISEINVPNDGFYSGGESVAFQMTFRNMMSGKSEDMKVTAMIPELGIYTQIGPFSVKARSMVTKVLVLDLPNDAVDGEYDLRLSVFDEDHTRIVYRPIMIR